MSFLRTRAFWVMVFEYLVVPVAAGAVLGVLVCCIIAMVAALTS